MKFFYKQYPAKKKEILEVTIDQPTKVKFMTAIDFRAYKNSRSYKYYGGSFNGPQVRFILPFDAVWYVVVEKGLRSAPLDVKSSCRLLPPDREALSTVALDAPQPTGGKKAKKVKNEVVVEQENDGELGRMD